MFFFSLLINTFSLFVDDNCYNQLNVDNTVIYTSNNDFHIHIVQDWLTHNELLLNKTKSHVMIFFTLDRNSNPSA